MSPFAVRGEAIFDGVAFDQAAIIVDQTSFKFRGHAAP